MAQLLHTVSSSNVLRNIPSLSLEYIRNNSGGAGDELRRVALNGGSNAPSVRGSLVPPIQIKPEDLCRINVSGKEYITTFSCLDKYPTTLLGSREREQYYIEDMKCYFFNRNRDCFDSILTFYQTGKEFRPLSVDESVYDDERKFFRIDEQPSDTSLAIEDEDQDQMGCFQNGGWRYTRRKVHKFLMDPRSSKFATGWHIMDILFICISITLLIMETDPNMSKYFNDESEPIHYWLTYLNVFVIAFFTTDLLVRFCTWPSPLSFWKNLFNILDILSILPFYVSVIADAMEGGQVEENHEHRSYVVLRVCRIFRIVRVFKFIRHSQDLIMIIKVVAHAKKELCLLILLLFIFSVSFGSLMYYIENQTNPEQFTSIMQGCWWAIVTITTIGYGDVVPKTWLGKIVGSVVLTLGIVFLALPMTIIVGKFSTVYEKEKEKS